MPTFDFYRFQLLPSSQTQQYLFEETYSADEIREKKNIFFNTVLNNELKFEHKEYSLNQTKNKLDEDLYLIKIAAYKLIDRENENFEKEKIPNWPSVSIIIDNAPENQTIFISRNQKAFSNTRIVAKILENSLNRYLFSFGLTIQIRETYDKNNFWNLIERHPKKVTRVRFEMVAPNMANISKALKLDLKKLNRESNCQNVNLSLNSLPTTSLEIDKDDELIAGCVEYSSEGGGDIAVKIKGIRKEIRVSDTVRTLEIEELPIKMLNRELLELLSLNKND